MISVKQNYTFHLEFLSLYLKSYILREQKEVGREEERSGTGQRKDTSFYIFQNNF